VFEVSMGDLKKDSEDEAFRKFKLKVEDVQGFNCLTNFHGMDLTTDKLRSIVRKGQTLIEAYSDVRTTDGYALRLFAIGFTKKHKDQRRATSYAQSSQVRAIRKKMQEIMAREGSNCDLNGLVEKLMNEVIGREIEKHTQAIYPLQKESCLIRKVKMLRSPKVDVTKLLELHGGADVLAQVQSGPHGLVHAAAQQAAAAKTAGSTPSVAAPAAAGGAPAASAPAGAAATTTAAAAPAGDDKKEKKAAAKAEGGAKKGGDGGAKKGGDGGAAKKGGDGGAPKKGGDGGAAKKGGDGGASKKGGDGGAAKKAEGGKKGGDGGAKKGGDGGAKKGGDGGAKKADGAGGKKDGGKKAAAKMDTTA